jgi:hypothetical protein
MREAAERSPAASSTLFKCPAFVVTVAQQSLLVIQLKLSVGLQQGLCDALEPQLFVLLIQNSLYSIVLKHHHISYR